MDLRAENATLREALRVLQERYDRLDATSVEQIQALTDENELLAEANCLLLEKQVPHQNASLQNVPSLLQVPDELLLPVSEPLIQSLVTLDKVHTFGNLLSVSAHVTRPTLVITGGADKCVGVHDWERKTQLCVKGTSGPVLALAFNPKEEYADYFVAAGMDARHALYKLVQRGDAWHVQVVAEFYEHSRQGTFQVAWSASGLLFATGASDKVVNVYQCSGLVEGSGESGVEQCKKIKSFYFNGTIEALVFAPDVVSKDMDIGREMRHELLVIAVRDDCYVHYVDCVTFEKERVNMNPDGIEHVSYTIMDLSLSPSGKYLLAATDSNRNFIFAVGCVSKRSVLSSFLPCPYVS
uniref:Anaphase-promoting complex subunit 4 WD40 domain-containing protein n=1 Tax=Hyaloperonospora arabidopsidis (strain Emoy2) TaxID=559515 RepID=M4BUV6_HYAAE